MKIGNVVSQNTNYWQQKVDYKMEVSIDVKTFLYKGKQELVYTNNSNDTLKKVYYHLFNNAFQPGSEMDMRLQNIKDIHYTINYIESNIFYILLKET